MNPNQAVLGLACVKNTATKGNTGDSRAISSLTRGTMQSVRACTAKSPNTGAQTRVSTPTRSAKMTRGGAGRDSSSVSTVLMVWV